MTHSVKKPFCSPRVVALLTFFLATVSAQAHTGQHGMSAGLGSGFFHPLSGWDHLLAMVAVGIWAVQIGRRSTWALPLTFAGFMIVGLIMGVSLPTAAFLEFGILLTVLMLGIFLVTAYRPTSWIGVGLVGGFALFHGCAHGMEMPTYSSGWLYALGMISATVLLHAGGIAIGRLLSLPSRQWIRLSGVAVLAAGLTFFFLG